MFQGGEGVVREREGDHETLAGWWLQWVTISGDRDAAGDAQLPRLATCSCTCKPPARDRHSTLTEEALAVPCDGLSFIRQQRSTFTCSLWVSATTSSSWAGSTKRRKVLCMLQLA
ncbi:hypothetical protein LIA77_05340 [Sarocladium implicatum]|nr:hypothetical protein LIA77_05340 [Sarocladium implicatum]